MMDKACTAFGSGVDQMVGQTEIPVVALLPNSRWKKIWKKCQCERLGPWVKCLSVSLAKRFG